MLGPWSTGFAILPIVSSWDRGGVLEAAERSQHPFLAAPGRRPAEDAGESAPASASGLRVTGRGIVLSALRRAGDELELRIVAEHPDPEPARIEGPFTGAREVDLLGRPVAELAVASPGTLELAIAPWEIRTIRLAAAR
jgi:alpha-mannosidase